MYENPYSVSVQLEKIDWKKVISERDRSKLAQSVDWRTCLIGQFTKQIKRLQKNNAPLDLPLAHIGIRFPYYYFHQDWNECEHYIKQAEKRVSELLGDDKK